MQTVRGEERSNSFPKKGGVSDASVRGDRSDRARRRSAVDLALVLVLGPRWEFDKGVSVIPTDAPLDPAGVLVSGEGAVKVYNMSRLQTLQSCEREYYWRYVKNLVPSFDGVPRPLGTAFHAAVKAFYDGKSREEAFKIGDASFWEEIPKNWGERGEKTIEKVKKGAIQLKAMVELYPFAIEPKEKIVALEKEINWKVPGTEIVLRFRVDRLIEVNGGLWLHDTKTTGQKDLATEIKVQKNRMQYAGYSAGAEAVLGKKIVGVMLDLVQKPSVYFRKDGGVTVGKPEFLREPMHQTPTGVEEFKEWLERGATEIWQNDPEKLIEWRKNTDSCRRYNSLCPYIELCLHSDWATSLSTLFVEREADYVDVGEDDE